MLLEGFKPLERIRKKADIAPFNLPIDIFDFFKLLTQLHNRKTNHSRIETEGSSNSHLDGSRSIKAHDEVMAVCIPGLVLRGRPGQAEGTPVRVAAYDAARSKDLNSGITGNSSISLMISGRLPGV